MRNGRCGPPAGAREGSEMGKGRRHLIEHLNHRGVQLLGWPFSVFPLGWGAAHSIFTPSGPERGLPEDSAVPWSQPVLSSSGAPRRRTQRASRQHPAVGEPAQAPLREEGPVGHRPVFPTSPLTLRLRLGAELLSCARRTFSGKGPPSHGRNHQRSRRDGFFPDKQVLSFCVLAGCLLSRHSHGLFTNA